MSGGKAKTRRQSLFANAMRNSVVARNSYQYGWPVDQERQQQIAKELDTRISETLQTIREQCREIGYEAWESYNPGSGKQTAHLFYTVLGQPLKRVTATGAPGTGKDSLQEIVDRNDAYASPLAETILAHKQARKLKEAYVTKLDGVSIVRPAAHVTAQLSGRWSYRDPALQTTPSRIKPMFVAHPGCWMVACDLSQAELRNMAQISGDKGMMRAYELGEDIHAATAMAAFGCTLEEAKGRERRLPAKIIGLGYNYSVLDDTQAAVGLYNQLISKIPNLTLESVLGIIDRLSKERAGVRAYKEQLWQQAQDLDYVEEPLNHRRRYFYGKPKDTEGYNFPCQGMTSAIVDEAAQCIDGEFLPGEGLHLQRHDELVVGGPDPTRLCELLWKHMRQTHTVKGNTLTYEIEYVLCKRWGEGAVAIEPHPRSGSYSSAEAICDCKSWNNEKAEIVGLENAVVWAMERVKA